MSASIAGPVPHRGMVEQGAVDRLVRPVLEHQVPRLVIDQEYLGDKQPLIADFGKYRYFFASKQVKDTAYLYLRTI